MTSDWIEVGRFDDIPRQGSRVVVTPQGDVAIFRTLTDRLFALRDRCPHAGGPLSQGIVHGNRVTCPLHNYVINLDDGTAVAPDRGQVGCFAVELRAGIVWVQLS